MLLALMDHEYLRSIDVQEGNMLASFSCIANLSTSKWWRKLRKLKMCAAQGETYEQKQFETALGALQNSKYLEFFSFPLSYFPSYDFRETEKQIVASCPNLKNIDWPYHSESSDYIQMMGSMNHPLEDLTLWLNTKDFDDALYSYIERYHNLKTLHLLSSKFRRFELLSQLKNLSSLEIQCPSMRERIETFQLLMPHSLPQIKSLRIVHVHPVSSRVFAAACPNLTRIELLLQREVADVDATVTPFIEHCSELEVVTIDLERRGHTVNFDPILCNIWSLLPKLKFFALRVEAGIDSGLRKSMAVDILQKSCSIQGILTNSVLYLRKETSLEVASEILSEHGFYNSDSHCTRIVVV